MEPTSSALKISDILAFMDKLDNLGSDDTPLNKSGLKVSGLLQGMTERIRERDAWDKNHNIMKPVLSDPCQDARSAEAERKAMIHSVQALAQRLSILEPQDYDLGSANSEAAHLLTRISEQVSTIAAKTPDKTGWDRNHFFDVVSGGYVINSVTVNPFCDTRLSKQEWADTKGKETLLRTIAHKKFVESISIEPAD